MAFVTSKNYVYIYETAQVPIFECYKINDKDGKEEEEEESRKRVIISNDTVDILNRVTYRWTTYQNKLAELNPMCMHQTDAVMSR